MNTERKSQTKPAPAPLHEKRWLNSAELSTVYDISISTQCRWRDKGILPYSKIGKVIRYDREAVDRMFDKHTVVA